MPKVSDAHREARRRQILEAALTCFAREGFHRTSMSDIIRESGLSPGAIYRYFPAKEDLIEAMAAERFRQESAVLAETLSGEDARAAIARFVRALFTWLGSADEERHQRMIPHVWAEALRNRRIAAIVHRGFAQRDALTAAFRRAIARGQLAADLDPDALSRLMLALVEGFILQRRWQPRLDMEAYAAAAAGLFDALFERRSARGRRQGTRGRAT
ncbi:MAG TPA: TetR family transcriptional regulator [Vicinamibacteria bacterium]